MKYSEFKTNNNQSSISEVSSQIINSIGFSCEKCVLPATYNNSATKTCKWCNANTSATNKFYGKEALIEDIALKDDEKLGVMVSGGKDSIFVWAQLIKLFGKNKVVAFNFQKKGLTHPVAIQNIINAQNLLGGDVVTIADENSQKDFLKNLEALLDKPDPAMVRVALCAGCRYNITKRLYDYGFEKYGITKYVSGASYLELAPFKEELLKQKGSGDEKQGVEIGLNENPKYDFNNNVERILNDIKYRYKGILSKNDSRTSTLDKYTLIDYDKYFDNNPYQIEKYCKDNLNWTRPERSWHFDCLIEEFKDIFYFGLLGYTESDFKLSAMVRHNLISRSDAINEVIELRNKMINSLDYSLNLLNKLNASYLKDKMIKFYQSSKYFNL